ncbi:MauE/DoxX family redox-associated membrane protein [Streptosporangium sp. CA-135522]|uniref:MauE/DoxX family redox-associated membrane protein n=1 Tax=Streptosporangium sp. CA-135522 TaxID=3240072 RepID=UPI003D8A0105
MQYAVLTFRCLLGLVFLSAVAGKLRDPAAFRASVADMVPVGPRGVPVVGRLTILAEICAVVLLAIPQTVPAGFVLAGTVLTGFSAGIARALRAGARTPCGCFGATATPLGARHLVRNAALLLFAVAGFALTGAGDAAHPAGIALALTTAALLALLVVFFEDIADLFA